MLKPRKLLVLPVVALLGTVVSLGWLLLLRPAFLGGPVSYVMVSGISMETTLHTGDLVVVRNQDSYTTGDIVAFQVEGGIVVHRIVGGSAEEGFVTQGDNRRTRDPWRPRPEQILGSMWLDLPGGGRVLAYLRRPLVFAAMVAGLGTFSVWRILWPQESKRRPLDGRLVPVKARQRSPARARRRRA